MGFLKKLFGGGNGEPPGVVWEVSDGLRAFGQREIAIAVRLRPGEVEAEIRAALRSFFETVRSLACEGKRVEAGGLTELGPSGFLSPAVRAIAYGDATGCTAPEIPAGSLVGVLLRADELELARATSVARVLRRLGEATREYPFPPVSDRDRSSVASPDDSTSVLARLPRLHLPHLSLVMENEAVIVSAVRGGGGAVQAALDQLPEGAAFAMLAGRSPRANGQLVWRPGQAGPKAITPPGSAGTSLSGVMLIVGPGAESDEVTIQEDGFALLARASTWADLRRALVEETAFELETDGLGLRVEHLLPGQHLPAGGARGPEEIVLLTPEAQLARAASVDELGAYVNALIAVLQAVEGVELRVELSGGPARLEVEGELTPELRAALAEVAPPEVSAPIAFLIRRPRAQ